MSSSILDVDDIERSGQTLSMSNDSDTSNVTSSGNHGEISGLEFDKIGHFASLQVEDEGVIDLQHVIGKKNGTKATLT